jgi:hypothetical protein
MPDVDRQTLGVGLVAKSREEIRALMIWCPSNSSSSTRTRSRGTFLDAVDAVPAVSACNPYSPRG